MDAQEDIRALLESRYLALDPQEDIGILIISRIGSAGRYRDSQRGALDAQGDIGILNLRNDE